MDGLHGLSVSGSARALVPVHALQAEKAKPLRGGVSFGKAVLEVYRMILPISSPATKAMRSAFAGFEEVYPASICCLSST